MTQVLDLVLDPEWALGVPAEKGNTEEWIGHCRLDPVYVSLPLPFDMKLRVSWAVFFGPCGLHPHGLIEVTLYEVECQSTDWLRIGQYFDANCYSCSLEPWPAKEVSFDANLEHPERSGKEPARIIGTLMYIRVVNAQEPWKSPAGLTWISRIEMTIANARRWKAADSVA